MRFSLIVAAALATVAAKHHHHHDFVDLTSAGEPEPPTEKEMKSKGYRRRIKDPNVRARYKNAMDKCRGQNDDKKRYQCFKRNWNLFKPHRSNKLTDLRARTHRACWKYKNNILKRAKCFAKHVKDYEGELTKGLLAEQKENNEEEQEQTVEEQFENEVDQEDTNPSVEDILIAMNHVNEQELSSASSTDSEASSTSSDDTSDDNNHKAKVLTSEKRLSGEGQRTPAARANANRRSAKRA